MDEARSKIIEDNPIGKGLDVFRTSFRAICENNDISYSPDAIDDLDQEGLQNLSISLLSALQILKASRQLPSRGRGGNLFGNLSGLNSSVTSDDFDFDRIIPLLKAAVDDSSADTLIWHRVYEAVTEPTPPPRALASSVSQTPWLHNTSSFANSSEYRQDVDKVLRSELGPLYVGLPRFYEKFFGSVAGLETMSEAVFKKCLEEELFDEGWRGWPQDAKQDDVLAWFSDLSQQLVELADGCQARPAHRRRPLAQPNKPIQGSTGERKMDIGFVSDPEAGKDSHCHWSHILVPGELKSNPSADTASKAWLDLGRYAREVFAAQDTRRFVIGFTLCGSLMRIWIFDRLGGIASEQFDINNDGLQFVFTILGFLWMNEEELGFDPTIVTNGDERYIEIEHEGRTERLILDKLMKRSPCIAGRATTCWKAYREDDRHTPLVIKDSWQYTEREEEGELLFQATAKGVINVARYYYHTTVHVRDKIDDIRNNVRGGLKITEATNHRPGRSMFTSSTTDSPRKGRSKAGMKRSSSQTDVTLPPTKRSYSVSPTKVDPLSNRVHRRIVLRDYGTPIYTASSRPALLKALEGCIQGHRSLRQAGFLHRDISANNLMINEDESNPSWRSFLIDLDLAIKEKRDGVSGARGKTGTRAFMAIGALLGEQHSFMHDLESFFWVLFWVCIHCSGPDESRVVSQFDKWNFVNTEELAISKRGVVADEGDFLELLNENVTPYYQVLIPWINRLRRQVFPNGERWRKEDEALYTRMIDILFEAAHSLATQ